MATTAPTRPDFIPIEDPDFYLDPWATFAWMRAERPFYLYEPLDTVVLTRYKDIRDVSIRPETFSNAKGIFLLDVKYREQAGNSTIVETFFPKGGEQVGMTDPPRHQELRRVMAPAFSIPALDAIRAPVAEHLGDMLDEIVPGEPLEWMDIAARVPITAACHLIGLPATDHRQVQHWSDQLENLGGDVDYDQLVRAAADFQSLQGYIVENVERLKRGKVEGLDLLSVLLNAELDAKKVTMANVVMFAMTALAAGSDTTRAMLGGIVHCFSENPDQWTYLRENRAQVPNAVEEIIRYVTPARAFLRVATEDSEVNGHPIRKDQPVYLMYMAANRDETEFEEPHRFDALRRNASRHLAFGAGPHLCAGMRLARMEGVVMLNALLDRFSGVRQAGPAVPVKHVIRNSWETLPAVFSA